MQEPSYPSPLQNYQQSLGVTGRDMSSSGRPISHAALGVAIEPRRSAGAPTQPVPTRRSAGTRLPGPPPLPKEHFTRARWHQWFDPRILSPPAELVAGNSANLHIPTRSQLDDDNIGDNNAGKSASHFRHCSCVLAARLWKRIDCKQLKIAGYHVSFAA